MPKDPDAPPAPEPKRHRWVKPTFDTMNVPGRPCDGGHTSVNDAPPAIVWSPDAFAFLTGWRQPRAGCHPIPSWEIVACRRRSSERGRGRSSGRGRIDLSSMGRGRSTSDASRTWIEPVTRRHSRVPATPMRTPSGRRDACRDRGASAFHRSDRTPGRYPGEEVHADVQPTADGPRRTGHEGNLERDEPAGALMTAWLCSSTTSHRLAALDPSPGVVHVDQNRHTVKVAC